MKSIGIVGGGITGLTCAYKLRNDFEVTLFEKDTNLGGQAQTVNANGIPVEAAVSVVASITYVEFFKLMAEIGYNGFKPYDVHGLHAHDPENTIYYFDANLLRFMKRLPGYIKEKPLGLMTTAQMVPFLYRLYFDYRKGKLDDVLIMDTYKLYPGYQTIISTVLTILSLITSVQVKNSTVSHLMNFVFDFENNAGYKDPIVQVAQLFMDITVPEGGVGSYIDRLRQVSNANFISDCEVIKVTRNTDSTVTVVTKDNGEHTFDHVIVATQPFQVASFLEFKDAEEEAMFKRLSKTKTNSMVTNHTDSGIYEDVKQTDGLIDFRVDHHENASQTTISRHKHFYTAQTLPESFNIENSPIKDSYVDTDVTPDNYAIKKDSILSQHFHSVLHMTPETSQLLDSIIKISGKDNLHFACSALSSYPTSQEGGVRSAIRVTDRIIKSG